MPKTELTDDMIKQACEEYEKARMEALDAFIGYMTGKDCFCSGDYPGIETECDNCNHYMVCYPDWHPGAYWDEDTQQFI